MTKKKIDCCSVPSTCEVEMDYKSGYFRLQEENKTLCENEANLMRTIEVLAKTITNNILKAEHFKNETLYYQNLLDIYRKEIFDYENKEKTSE